MSLPIYVKQSADKIDVDIDFTQFFSGTTDTIASATSFAAVGDVTGDAVTLTAPVINTAQTMLKQWVSGGTTGNKYKITVQMTSAEGRIHEVDFNVKVKDT